MDLAFGPGTFDAVTIGFGIPHVPDPARVLGEARRVLRPGGRLAFSVWCGPEVDTALGYVFGAIETHGHPDIALPPGPGATDYADPARAFPVLAAAGFAECRRDIVASMWRVEDPAAPFDFFREGTARGGALLRPQPDRQRGRHPRGGDRPGAGEPRRRAGLERADPGRRDQRDRDLAGARPNSAPVMPDPRSGRPHPPRGTRERRTARRGRYVARAPTSRSYRLANPAILSPTIPADRRGRFAPFGAMLNEPREAGR